jgi:hypothetical protein
MILGGMGVKTHTLNTVIFKKIQETLLKNIPVFTNNKRQAFEAKFYFYPVVTFSPITTISLRYAGIIFRISAFHFGRDRTGCLKNSLLKEL